MTRPEFYGAGFPYREEEPLQGHLIVIEGTDGVGRSTLVKLLRTWLEQEGYAVSDTGLRRSPLTQSGLNAAKAGHTLSPITMSLFYATDFADRLESQILPALRAGFIVLSDRYFYSVLGRDVVRGIDPSWTKDVYGFALKPDLVLYMKANVDTLVSRIINGRGFNYWEAGMDIHCADNLYDSFVSYQTMMLDEFDKLASEYNFEVIDANRTPEEIFEDAKTRIERYLKR